MQEFLKEFSEKEGLPLQAPLVTIFIWTKLPNIYNIVSFLKKKKKKACKKYVNVT